MLSTSIVSRGVILLERDEFGELVSVALKAAIVLARCPRCGTRARVLPYDVLPYKQYSVAVITELASTYATGSASLRSVVWDLLGERTPAHTTLHGWTEGLGAHVLGLPGGEAGGVPFSRFVVEAQARVAWCKDRRGYYEVGVEFLAEDDMFRARMVEQVCHIEHYRKAVKAKEGRRLSREEAALEWIAKHAADFPKVD